MEIKKAKDEADQVEGRENFDYTVERKRKKASTIVEEPESPTKEPKNYEKYGYKIEPEVLEWVKERLENLLLMFDESKHWNKNLEEAVQKLILLDGSPKLFIWVADDKVYFE